MKYRPEIDGLRALAVLGVMLFHGGFDIGRGGYIGVDVFFVISGWLITSLILSEKQAGRFSFRDFYERRARRILPALFLVLIACLPPAWLWLAPQELSSFLKTLIAAVFSLSNIVFMRQVDYFNGDTDTNPLLHTWSLSIEEQFYFFYPALLLGVLKFKRFNLMIIGFCTVGMSLFLAEWALRYHAILAFYLLPTRAWEFLIGALIAIHFVHYKGAKQLFKAIPNRFQSYLIECGASLGIVLIGYGFLTFNKSTSFPGYAALFPTLGTALIILCANSTTIVGKILGNPLFRGLGLISYSTYLWHQPLFAFARIRSIYAQPSSGDFALLIVVTLFLASLSWYFVERPFRNRAIIEKKTLIISTAFFIFLFLLIGIGGIITKGYPSSFGRPASIVREEHFQFPTINNGWCFYSVDSISNLDVGQSGVGCELGVKGAKRRGLLFGDSFAGQYEPFWNNIATANLLTINSITTNWCYPSLTRTFPGPIPGRAYQQCLFNRAYVSTHLENYDFVIVAGNWGNLGNQERLLEVLKFIEFLAKKKMFVIVMPSPPVYDGDVGYSFSRANIFEEKFDLTRFTTLRDLPYEEANNKLKILALDYKNIFYIERSSIFDLIGSGLDAKGYPLSLDGKHISIGASIYAAERFRQSRQYQEFVKWLSDSRL